MKAQTAKLMEVLKFDTETPRFCVVSSPEMTYLERCAVVDNCLDLIRTELTRVSEVVKDSLKKTCRIFLYEEPAVKPTGEMASQSQVNNRQSAQTVYFTI